MPDTATMLTLTMPKNKGSHAARRIGDPTLSTIMQVVAEDYNMPVEDMLISSRRQRYSHPRMVVTYLARRLTAQSYPMIARKLGLTDHTTCIYARRRVQAWADARPDVKERLDQLAEECRRRTP